MTIEQFNALPEEARLFIKNRAGCLGCGGDKEKKLSEAYQAYLKHKKMATYRIKGGGINYVNNGVGGVLYGIGPEDTDDEIRFKLDVAAEIYEIRPNAFYEFDINGMQELRDSLEPVPEVGKNKKKAAKAEAETAKAEAGTAKAEAEAAETAAKAEAETAAPARAADGKFQKKDEI